VRLIDLAIIAVYLLGVTWFGARFKESQKTLKDYFLGGQTAPWWAIALSIVSAETSTLTIIGTPPLAFGGSYVFLQIVFGYLLARIVISTIFLPQYFSGHFFTAYELMQRRFGPNVRKVTAGIFLITRSLAEGVRVFAISIVIGIILHTGGLTSIVVIVCLTLFYTFEGGMTAVIWTDVLQMFMYVLLTAYLVQKGSAESRPLDDPAPQDEDPRGHRTDRNAPWAVRRGSELILRLYENSLAIAFGVVFLLSLWLHAATGAAAYSEEQELHGGAAVTTWSYLGTSQFWYESLQNWQSEFLAVAAIIGGSIYLRQRRSAQSKPVHAPHSETGG